MEVAKRRGSPLAGAAAALMMMGAGSLVTASNLDHPSIERLGPNVPINAGAVDKRVIEANNSPSIARHPADPTHLVVANRVDVPGFSCALNLSTDGGATWEAVTIPFPAGEELPERCFAPDVAFAADGTLYMVFVTLKGAGNVPNAGWLVSSKDGGKNLSTPRQVVGPFSFQVRLVTDPEKPRRLYLSWVQATGTAGYGFADAGNPVMSSRSDDAGVTWRPPVRVNPEARDRVVAPEPAIATGGPLFVVYTDLGDDALDYHGGHEGRGGPPYPGPWSLVLARSDDEGRTWRETVVDDSVVPIERVVVFEAPFPSLAVSPSGREVVVAYADARRGDADVWLWRSTDGGRSFSPGRRVNDTSPGDGTSQYLPAVDLGPGRIDIAYYDRRADAENVDNEVSFQTSWDGATTFTPRLRLSDRQFDSTVGFGRERGIPDLGSRLGLASSPERTIVVWADTRGGTEAAIKQDLALAALAVTGEAPLREPLRYAGMAALAAGLGVGAWAVVGHVTARRRRPELRGSPSA